MSCQKSEIAQILEQIDAEHEAARRGLSGLAQGTARHQVITARAERVASLHARLSEVVGDPTEALRIVIEHNPQIL